MLKKILFICLILVSGISNALAQTIKGRVLDEKGESLPSATIVIKELNRGMSSDDMGKFRFTHLPARELTLEVSFVGYQNYTQKVDLAKQRDAIVEVKMVVSNNLNDVEVFGERYKQPEKLDP